MSFIPFSTILGGLLQEASQRVRATAVLSLCALIYALLAGCTGMPGSLEKPDVNVTSIKIGANEGLEQRFIVGLRITNPNRVALPIHGMSYNLALDGINLAKGVTNKIDTIPAYGEAKIDVEVGISLLSGVRLIQRLMSQQGQELGYTLDAKLDVGSAFMPRMVVSESGTVPFLSSSTSTPTTKSTTSPAK